MNLKAELQKMNLSDLRFVYRDLGLSCSGNKSNIIKKLLKPLKKRYQMQQIPESVSNEYISKYLTDSELGSLTLTSKNTYKDLKKSKKERFKQMYTKEGMVKKYRQSFERWIETEISSWRGYEDEDYADLINNMENNPKNYILHFLLSYKSTPKYEDLKIILINPELAKEFDLNVRLPDGRTCLLSCLSLNDIDPNCALLFIKAGADVNIQDIDNGYNALMYAWWLINNWESLGLNGIMKQLLDAGADVNIVYNNSNTILIEVSKCDINNTLQMLLEHSPKPDVNHIGFNGMTALMHVIKMNENKEWISYEKLKNYEHDVQILLEHGANVNIQDEQGVTALIYILAKPKYEFNFYGDRTYSELELHKVLELRQRFKKKMVQLLIDNGAIINITDNLTGGNATRYAKDGKHQEIYQLLVEKENEQAKKEQK